jgi:hypothetical protein
MLIISARSATTGNGPNYIEEKGLFKDTNSGNSDENRKEIEEKMEIKTSTTVNLKKFDKK